MTELFDRGIGCGQRPPIVIEVWSWSLAGVFVVSDALAVSDQNARPNGSLDALTRERPTKLKQIKSMKQQRSVFTISKEHHQDNQLETYNIQS